MVLVADQEGKLIYDQVMLLDHNKNAVRDQVKLRKVTFFD